MKKINNTRDLIEIENSIEVLKGYLNYLIIHEDNKDRILKISMDLDYLLNAYYEKSKKCG